MKKKISRRRFITSSALAAGAIMITPAIIEGQGIGSKPAKKALSSYDAKVRELLSQMTLEEKIGQMTQAEQDALKDINDIEKYSLGSLLSGGGSDPKAGNSLLCLD